MSKVGLETEVEPSLQLHCEKVGLVVGTSKIMHTLINDVCRVAESDFPILINGDTGSGKEIIAKLIHELGSPEKSPFLDVNCGAIPEALIESQLFGHEKGAFTGATNKQAGYFSLASNGVLFLDEIAELPLWQQTKLLRVLETRQFRPVGGAINQRFHGRIIAATHVDLKKRVEEKSFREDLYYRLNIVQLRVPALHERREDIPLLVEHFANKYTKTTTYSPSALEHMKSAHWKGNIRELKNTVDRISIMSDSGFVDTDEVKNYVSVSCEDSNPTSRINELALSLLQLDIPNKLSAIEYAVIQTALQNSDGNKSSAARLLGVHRKYIERRLNSFDEKLDEIHQLRKTATKKMEQSQYKEAIKDLRLAIQNIENGISPQEFNDIKLDLLLKLSACLRNIHGWNHSEVVSLYEDAQNLTQNLGDPEKLNSVHFGMWANQLIELDLDDALATTAAYWREGKKINNPNVTAQAAITMANTHYWMGNYHQTSATLQQFIDLYSHDQRIVIDFGHDPFVYYLMLKSLVAFQTGKVMQSSETLQNLMTYAREVNQPFSLATALQVGAWLSYKQGKFDICYDYAKELLDLSLLQCFPFFEGMSEIFLGHQIAAQGDYKKGKKLIVNGYHIKLNGGKGKLFNSMYGIVLADIALSSGKYELGLEDIEKTILISKNKNERCYLAEEILMRGKLNLKLHRKKEALQDFSDAISQAHEHGSKAADLKASYELASYHVAQNHSADARRVLTPVVLRFVEQQNYLDLTVAKSLLSKIESNALSSA